MKPGLGRTLRALWLDTFPGLCSLAPPPPASLMMLRFSAPYFQKGIEDWLSVHLGGRLLTSSGRAPASRRGMAGRDLAVRCGQCNLPEHPCGCSRLQGLVRALVRQQGRNLALRTLPGDLARGQGDFSPLFSDMCLRDSVPPGPPLGVQSWEGHRCLLQSMGPHDSPQRAPHPSQDTNLAHPPQGRVTRVRPTC